MEKIPLSLAKRRTVSEKLSIVSFAKENSIHKAAERFIVDRKSIRDWTDQEDDLKQVPNKNETFT